MRKADRHHLIKQIIQQEPIRNQGQLMNKLEENGVNATQATISRDIRDLQIIKSIDPDGQPRFVIFQIGSAANESKSEESARLDRLIKEVVTNVQQVQFMTVVNTLPDNAHLLASLIDEIKPAFIVATMASFDTIIVISKDAEDAAKATEFLNQRIH